MKGALIIAAAVAVASPGWAHASAPDQTAAPVGAGRIAEADGSLTLVHELDIAAPARAIWAAISTREGWTRWGVPVAWLDPADSDVLETSYDPRAAYGAPQNIRQRFLLRVPNRLLAFQTIKAPAGFADAERFAGIRTVFELTPLGENRTRVRLTGVGYPGDEAGRRLLNFFEQGNAATLENLRAALAAPKRREE